MKNCTLALALGTAVVTTVLSLVAESAHALTFRFDGLRTDDDSFDLILTTEDTRLFSTLCDNFCLWNREMLTGQDF
jgi:hypothetical protein